MNKLLAGAVAVGMLTWVTVFDDNVAAADTALIVPGTAPSPYGPLRSLYHFNPAMQPQIDANYYSPAAVRRVVPYPGSFWPVTGLNSPTVNSSVTTGADNLDAAIRTTDGPISVAGLSQGSLALDREQARLAHDPTAPPPGQLTFIKAGNPDNLLYKAFGPGTHVPIIDYTVPPPVQSQYDTVNIVGQYDPFSDPPNHPGNLLADLNAVAAGGYYGHTATAFSDPSRVAPWDVTRTTNGLGGTSTTYFIRNSELPLARALVDGAGMPPEAVGPIDAALRPLVDRAYDPGPAHNPVAMINGIAHIPTIISAVSWPVRGAVTGVNLATNSLAVANLARAVAPGPRLGKGPKGLLPRAVRALVKARK
ncbi:PE-PPE domain-containing protein [Mycobacterium scrofulaceum]|uniref:PE-PPE domain-containing protein n=1 Tax=Mycobacterium scrofulaceum TaxID=1783 RepID=A0A1X0KIF2_MYCSC|nr:PE-PPE domain-containing protein [Mycobacterium scrofulaceum]